MSRTVLQNKTVKVVWCRCPSWFGPSSCSSEQGICKKYAGKATLLKSVDSNLLHLICCIDLIWFYIVALLDLIWHLRCIFYRFFNLAISRYYLLHNIDAFVYVVYGRIALSFLPFGMFMSILLTIMSSLPLHHGDNWFGGGKKRLWCCNSIVSLIDLSLYWIFCCADRDEH